MYIDSAGINRIVYQSAGLVAGLTVTAYIWDEALTKSSLQTFTELESGGYYLDYNFATAQTYMGIFYEGGTAKLITSIRVGSVNTDIDFIKYMIGGRWKIVNHQLIHYKEDNTTEVARFNLFGRYGTPDDTDVHDVVRV